MTILATLTALLLLATVRQWRKVRADDAPAAPTLSDLALYGVRHDDACDLCTLPMGRHRYSLFHADRCATVCGDCFAVLRPAREAA